VTVLDRVNIRSTSSPNHRLLLLEHALRQLSRTDQACWEEIPLDLHPSFARYMSRQVWTGLPDPMSLREAALQIVRDAIARLGEFADLR